MMGGKGRMLQRRPITLGAALLILTLGGCQSGGAPHPEVIPDPETGEFLTLEQQWALSSEEIDAYCGQLNAYLEQLREDIRFARHLSDSLGTVLDSLNNAHSETNKQTRLLEQELRQLKSARQGSTEYVTREGDTLMKLATLFYGSAANWRKIYDANRDKIDEPTTALKPNLRLAIPR